MPWTTYLLLAAAAVAAFVVGNVVASWAAGVTRGALERAGAHPAVRQLAVLAVRPLVVAVAVIAALGYLGADTSGLAVLLGAAALALGLALRGSVSNVASGGILLSLRPFREGDRVRIAGQEGTVLEQGLVATTLRADDGTVVTVPNDRVLSADVHNFSRAGQRRVEVEVTVPEADVDGVIERLAAAMSANGHVLTVPAPEVVVLALDPAGVRLAARAWVPVASWEVARSELHRAALAATRAPAGKPRERRPQAVGGDR